MFDPIQSDLPDTDRNGPIDLIALTLLIALLAVIIGTMALCAWKLFA